MWGTARTYLHRTTHSPALWPRGSGIQRLEHLGALCDRGSRLGSGLHRGCDRDLCRLGAVLLHQARHHSPCGYAAQGVLQRPDLSTRPARARRQGERMRRLPPSAGSPPAISEQARESSRREPWRFANQIDSLDVWLVASPCSLELEPAVTVQGSYTKPPLSWRDSCRFLPAGELRSGGLHAPGGRACSSRHRAPETNARS